MYISGLQSIHLSRSMWLGRLLLILYYLWYRRELNAKRNIFFQEKLHQHTQNTEDNVTISYWKKVIAWIGTVIVGLSLGVMTTPVTLLMVSFKS